MTPSARLRYARENLLPHVIKTPLIYDSTHDIYLKLENRQITGSFKSRGALNKVFGRNLLEQARGSVAAAHTNWGLGLAMAGRIAHIPMTLFISDQTDYTWTAMMKNLGADVYRNLGDQGEIEEAGLTFATERERDWISSYADDQVIAGHATVGLEVAEQLGAREIKAMVVPVGGGGLAAGLGAAIRETGLKVRLIGAQVDGLENRADFPALADGLKGMFSQWAIPLSNTCHFVDDFFLVKADEIAYAIAYAWYIYGEKIEGAAATGLATILAEKVLLRPAVIILSGGNIHSEKHLQICEQYRDQFRLEHRL